MTHRWHCEHFNRPAKRKWLVRRREVTATNRELARVNGAAWFGCLVVEVCVRYLGTIGADGPGEVAL